MLLKLNCFFCKGKDEKKHMVSSQNEVEHDMSFSVSNFFVSQRCFWLQESEENKKECVE